MKKRILSIFLALAMMFTLVVPAYADNELADGQGSEITSTDEQAPAEPAPEVDPEAPADPEDPADPETPDDPEIPVDPEDSVDPDAPNEAEDPDKADPDAELPTEEDAKEEPELITAEPEIVDLEAMADGERTVTDSGTCGAQGDNLTWTLYNNHELVIEGSGEMANYTGIPAPWSRYAYNNGVTFITSVVLSTGLTRLGDYAFSRCEGITSISIPSSVTNIGREVFRHCKNLESVSIPSSVTSISIQVFSDCPLLTTAGPIGGEYAIQFGWDQAIPAYAFYECENLESVTIPSGVTSIGMQAFRGCENLDSVMIPSSVTEIEHWAFDGCTSLTTAGPIGGEYAIQFGWDQTIPANAFYNNFTSLESVVIPSGVTSIGNYAFYQCDGLTSISIPSSVANIGGGAFHSCEGLESVTIPAGVTSIGMQAFYGCASLESVTISSGVTSIGHAAFYGCASLESVTIPSSVTSMSSEVFYGCPLLTTVGPIGGDYAVRFGWNQEIPAYAFKSCSALESVTIPSGVTSIGSNAFSGCGALMSVTIPASVRYIGSDAFNSISLTDVYYSGYASTVAYNRENGWSYAGNEALFNATWHCTDVPEGAAPCGNAALWTYDARTRTLTIEGAAAIWDQPDAESAPWYDYAGRIRTLVIGEGVTRIGNHAFDGCTALQSVTLPSTLTEIGDYAFKGCSNMAGFDLPFGLTTLGLGAFKDCSSLTSITIPSGVRSLGGNLFNNCTALTTVTLPNGLREIGGWAFGDCTNLTDPVIPATVTEIGEAAFSGCYGLTSLVIPDSVTQLGEYALMHCNHLTSVTLPSGLTAIPNGLFAGCEALASVDIPGGVTEIGYYSFALCYSLTSLVLPASVTSIGDEAFDHCSALRSINIPAGVTSIGSGTFSSCSSLRSITLPTGLTRIWDEAFAYCTSLTEIEFPESVTRVDARAFDGDSSLSKIVFFCEPPALTDSTFQNVTARALYSGDRYWWPEDLQDYGGRLTWVQCYEVSYDANGGTGAPAWQLKEPGSALTLSGVVPTRSDRIFRGWAETPDAAQPLYQPGGLYSRDQSSTLYALWTMITSQPVSQTVSPNSQVTFSVAASGSGVSYRWYYRTNAEDSWKAAGAASASTANYTITAQARHDGYQYRCRVYNDNGAVYSEVVTLTIGRAPEITAQPVSQAVAPNTAVTFSTEADDGASYRWYYRTSAEAAWTAAGAASASTANYSITAQARHDGYQYRCRVSNAYGAVYSEVVTLTVGGAPEITAQPVSQTVAPNTAITFSVTASGEGLGYRWYYRTNAEDSWKAAGAASASTANYSITAQARHDGYQYRCRVYNDSGAVYSEIVTLTIGRAPEITAQPVSQTVAPNTAITFSVTATGEGLGYRWYYRTSAEAAWTAAGAASASTANYSITAQARHNGYQYRCRVYNANGTVYSEIVTLTVG